MSNNNLQDLSNNEVFPSNISNKTEINSNPENDISKDKPTNNINNYNYLVSNNSISTNLESDTNFHGH